MALGLSQWIELDRLFWHLSEVVFASNFGSSERQAPTSLRGPSAIMSKYLALQWPQRSDTTADLDFCKDDRIGVVIG